MILWAVVLEKTLKSPLDCKEIKPVNPKGNQSWIFIRRTAAEAEAPILWPPGAESWPIRKDPDAGKDWRQEEKGTTEDEMVGWYHWLYGYEFEQVLGDGKGQGSLACCSLWGHNESDTTEWLNNSNNWITLLSSRNERNTINQLYFNKISFKKQKKKYCCLNETYTILWQILFHYLSFFMQRMFVLKEMRTDKICNLWKGFKT